MIMMRDLRFDSMFSDLYKLEHAYNPHLPSTVLYTICQICQQKSDNIENIGVFYIIRQADQQQQCLNKKLMDTCTYRNTKTSTKNDLNILFNYICDCDKQQKKSQNLYLCFFYFGFFVSKYRYILRARERNSIQRFGSIQIQSFFQELKFIIILFYEKREELSISMFFQKIYRYIDRLV